MTKPNKEKGFTFVELLIVISLIGLISSLVLASLNHKKEEIIVERFELKQLDLDSAQETSGSFFVLFGFGGGSVNSERKFYYTFYRSTDVANTYQIETIETKNDAKGDACVVVVEDVETNPFVERIRKNSFACDYYWSLHIPKGTLLNTINPNI